RHGRAADAVPARPALGAQEAPGGQGRRPPRDAGDRAALDRVAARPRRGQARVVAEPGVRHAPAADGAHPDPGIDVTRGASRAVVAIAAAAVLLVASASPASSSRTPHATAPLTGRIVAARVARRPAVTVKIENTPDARPQSGLADADVVYEEVLEGGVTRFAAVFHSRVPTWAGPVRSVREMDPAIVAPLRGAVAFSGGTDANVALLRDAPVRLVDEANGGAAVPRI